MCFSKMNISEQNNNGGVMTGLVKLTAQTTQFFFPKGFSKKSMYLDVSLLLFFSICSSLQRWICKQVALESHGNSRDVFVFIFFQTVLVFLFSWTENIPVNSWPELKISSHCLLFLRFCHLIPENVVVNITIKLFVPIWHVFSSFLFFSQDILKEC